MLIIKHTHFGNLQYSSLECSNHRQVSQKKVLKESCSRLATMNFLFRPSYGIHICVCNIFLNRNKVISMQKFKEKFYIFPSSQHIPAT